MRRQSAEAECGDGMQRLRGRHALTGGEDFCPTQRDEILMRS